MTLIFRYAARSDVGMVSAKNDDSAYVGANLAILADGMGGHAGGDVASASTVLDLVSLDHANYGDDPDIVFADEIQNANSTLRQLVSTNPKLSGMGTTLTGLLLTDDKLTFAHIGDSRAYRLKDGVFEQMSEDHTFVQMLVEEGRLTPSEAAVHPNKNVVMRVLGDVDASPEVDISRLDAAPGEKWFLFSDGVTDVLPVPTIERIVREARDLNAAVNTLVDMTLAGGAPDNTTAIAVEVATATEKDLADIALAEALRHDDESDPDTDDAATDAPSDEGTTAPDAPVGPTSPGSPASQSLPKPEGSFLDDTSTHEVEKYARAIRQELASRPHLLVGAASLATETGQLPVVSAKLNGAKTNGRAANVLTHQGESQGSTYRTYWEEERSVPHKRWILPAFLAVMVAILCVVTWLGYAWTQTQYYVGEANGQVAIYKGVSQTVGPLKLSKVVERENLPMGVLPDFNYQRVQDTIAAKDLDQAKSIVVELRSSAHAMGCIPGEVAAPSSSTAPTAAPGSATAAPGEHAPGTSPTPSPSPSASGHSQDQPITSCSQDAP